MAAMVNVLRSGTKVQICGLKSEEGSKLNGIEGIVDRFMHEQGRYAVSMPGGARMVKQKNLKVLEEPPTEEKVFAGEDEMMDQLKRMGMPAAAMSNLTSAQKKALFEMTTRQDILEAAKARDDVVAPAVELKPATGYSWRDASDHIYMEVPCSMTAKKDVLCTIEPESIKIASSAGHTILEGSLFQTIDIQKSKWELDLATGKVLVTLAKAKNMRWLMVLR